MKISACCKLKGWQGYCKIHVGTLCLFTPSSFLPMVNLRFLTHSLLPRKFVGAKKRFFFPLFALTSKELTLLWCSATVCVWQSTVWWKILWLIFPDPHFITALRKSLAYVKFIHNQRKNCDAKNQKWWIYKFEKRKSGIWERREKNLCCVESVEGVRRVWDWESRENGERKSTLMMMELERELWTVRVCVYRLVHLERWWREGNIKGDEHVA